MIHIHLKSTHAKLATLLDNMGSVKLDHATLVATIKNEKISHMILSFTGTQTVDDANADIDVSIELSIKKLNKINFPNDLDNYKNETAED